MVLIKQYKQNLSKIVHQWINARAYKFFNDACSYHLNEIFEYSLLPSSNVESVQEITS